jgi:hypothetical protein
LPCFLKALGSECVAEEGTRSWEDVPADGQVIVGIREVGEARSSGISGNNTDTEPKRSEKLSGMKKDADAIAMGKILRCIHQNRIMLLTKTVLDHRRRHPKTALMSLPVLDECNRVMPRMA